MANVKISELPASAAVVTTQEFEVNDSGTSKKVTGSQIESFIKSNFIASDLKSGGDLTIADKIVHTGDTNTSIRFPAADTVTVETSGTERLRVSSAGNVGIGTTSPTQTLTVNGTIGGTIVATQAEAEAGTDTTKLMTPQRVAQAIDVRAAGQLLASWDYSSNVSSIAFTELSGWRNLSIIFTNVTSSTASSQIRLSTDNGSSYVATGYISAVFDNVGGDAVTNGLAISRGASGTIDGEVKLLNFGTPTLKNHWGILKVATGSRVSVSSGAINLAACNAFQISGGTYSSGKISVYGEGKV